MLVESHKRITLEGNMNWRLSMVFMMFFLCDTVFSLDLSTQREIYRTDSFVFYADDDASYADRINFVEQQNIELERVFSRHIRETIRVYIFESQLSFSRHVFNSETPVQNATAMADHVSMALYITSPRDECKSYGNMRIKMLFSIWPACLREYGCQ